MEKLQLAVKKFNHEFLNPSRTWDEELIKNLNKKYHFMEKDFKKRFPF